MRIILTIFLLGILYNSHAQIFPPVNDSVIYYSDFAFKCTFTKEDQVNVTALSKLPSNTIPLLATIDDVMYKSNENGLYFGQEVTLLYNKTLTIPPMNSSWVVFAEVYVLGENAALIVKGMTGGARPPFSSSTELNLHKKTLELKNRLKNADLVLFGKVSGVVNKNESVVSEHAPKIKMASIRVNSNSILRSSQQIQIGTWITVEFPTSNDGMWADKPDELQTGNEYILILNYNRNPNIYFLPDKKNVIDKRRLNKIKLLISTL
ncbi:MAG: hypothetical protein ACPGLV_12810 [Bacteroidia bacterium]